MLVPRRVLIWEPWNKSWYPWIFPTKYCLSSPKIYSVRHLLSEFLTIVLFQEFALAVKNFGGVEAFSLHQTDQGPTHFLRFFVTLLGSDVSDTGGFLSHKPLKTTNKCFFFFWQSVINSGIDGELTNVPLCLGIVIFKIFKNIMLAGVSKQENTTPTGEVSWFEKQTSSLKSENKRLHNIQILFPPQSWFSGCLFSFI